MSLISTPFTKALTNLRVYEELTLYGNLLDISQEDEEQTRQFLASEYNDEALNFPFNIPEFDTDVAIWGARITYIAAQLVTFRRHEVPDLKEMIVPCSTLPTASSMLSADLCLRFIPDILDQLKRIDPEDVLIDLLEDILHHWHYSGVGYKLDYDKVIFDQIPSDQCFFQLYLNRIVEHKNLKLAQHPYFATGIASNLGIYSRELWKDFKKPNSSDE